MTDFFQGNMPQIPEAEKARLEKIYPKLKGKEDKISEKYIDEKVNDKVMKNFDKVKEQIRTMVEKEYLRTKPFADAKAAEQEQQ